MSSPVTTPPRSQALLALQIVAWIGGIGGVILIITGAALDNSPRSYLDGANPLQGLPALIWGGALLNIAVLAIFSLLIVAAVRWVAPSAPKPVPVRGPLRAYIKPENGPQLSIYDREVWLEGVAGGSIKGVAAKFVPAVDETAKNQIYVAGPDFDFTYTAENPPSEAQQETFQKAIDLINDKAREFDAKT